MGKFGKLGKLSKSMPKFNTLNKSSKYTKHIVIVIAVVILAFTTFYLVHGMSWKPVEKFVDGEHKAFVVKLIYSDNCPHCVAFKPTFETVSGEGATRFPGMNVTFVKSSVDTATDYSKFVANGIPAVLIIAGDEKPENVDETKTLVGNMSVDDFTEKLKERLV